MGVLMGSVCHTFLVTAVDADDDTDAGPEEVARVSRFLKRRRGELGLSQRGLAEAAKVSLGMITRIEREVGLPRTSNTPKLEDALQWPRGTFQAIRDGHEPPQIAPGQPAPDVKASSVPTGFGGGSGAAQHAQALSITSAVIAIAEICLQVLRGECPEGAASQALMQLDTQLRHLESLIAASLPDAESFDDAMAVLSDVHHGRQAIKKAAEDLG